MSYKDYNDYELILAFNENDDDAKKILLEKYYPLIYSVAKNYYQYLINHQIEEIIFDDLIIIGEETLLTISKSYDERAGVLFYTYFLRCLKSKFNTLVRSYFAKKNQPNFHYQAFDYEIEDFCAISNSEDNPLIATQQYLLEDKIKDYLYQLPFLQQAIIELRINGFRYYEIVNLLQVSKDYISKTVKKVKEELKQIIN